MKKIIIIFSFFIIANFSILFSESLEEVMSDVDRNHGSRSRWEKDFYHVVYEKLDFLSSKNNSKRFEAYQNMANLVAILIAHLYRINNTVLFSSSKNEVTARYEELFHSLSEPPFFLKKYFFPKKVFIKKILCVVLLVMYEYGIPLDFSKDRFEDHVQRMKEFIRLSCTYDEYDSFVYDLLKMTYEVVWNTVFYRTVIQTPFQEYLAINEGHCLEGAVVSMLNQLRDKTVWNGKKP